MKLAVSVEDAVEIMGISNPEVRKLLHHNYLKHSKWGKKYLIRVDAIDEFLKRIEGHQVDPKNLDSIAYLFEKEKYYG